MRLTVCHDKNLSKEIWAPQLRIAAHLDYCEEATSWNTCEKMKSAHHCKIWQFQGRKKRELSKFYETLDMAARWDDFRLSMRVSRGVVSKCGTD